MSSPQKDYLLMGALSLALFCVLGYMVLKAIPAAQSRQLAERPAVRPAEWPADRRINEPAEPASPGVSFEFDDIERACGDLSSRRNYICLLNRGNEQIAGGGRLVLDERDASFTGHGMYENGISIRVEGNEGWPKNSYTLEFGPPRGKALIPGLYTGATRWPFHEGLHPGIDVSVGSSGCNTENGQFRILRIQLADDKVQQFLADFETTCNSAIGRIALDRR